MRRAHQLLREWAQQEGIETSAALARRLNVAKPQPYAWETGSVPLDRIKEQIARETSGFVPVTAWFEDLEDNDTDDGEAA
jgi:hypothetical protein